VLMYDNPPLRPLRLDWRFDGLGFMDDDSVAFKENVHCPPDRTVRLKVFDTPLPTKNIIDALKTLEECYYDHETFNSKHFCDHLYAVQTGVEY